MDPKKPTLNWKEQLSTGVTEIDEQHKILIAMLNEANQCLLTNHNRQARLSDLIRDLMSYALYHFEMEEALMLRHDYPHRDQALHIQEHRQFSEKVASLQRSLNHGQLLAAEELTSFLGDWLHKHILTTDKTLASFLIGQSS